MATCWQLLSLCLESAGCSLSTPSAWVGVEGCGEGGREVRVRQTAMGEEGGAGVWEEDEEDEEEAGGL